VKFSVAIDEYIRDMWLYGSMNSPRSEVSYRARLGAHADDVANRDPRATSRDDVKRTLARWAHPNTQRTAHAILVSFYDWCMEEEIRKDNPARQVRRAKKRPSRVYRLTRSETVRVLNFSLSSRRDARLAHLATCAGLRNQELRGVQGRHFERPGFVWVSPDIGKGGRERWVPVIPELEPVVADILRYVDYEEFVLPARRPANPPLNTLWRVLDQPSSPQAIWRGVVDLAARAGIKAHIHPHLLRHAFGDHVAKYAGLKAAQEMLGHVEVGTTAEFYVDRPSLDELAVSVMGFRYRRSPTEEARVFRLEAPTGIEPVGSAFDALEPKQCEPGPGEIRPLRDDE
jgi:site-specific recombinase XerD